jgi:hypothetical protein
VRAELNCLDVITDVEMVYFQCFQAFFDFLRVLIFAFDDLLCPEVNEMVAALQEQVVDPGLGFGALVSLGQSVKEIEVER